MTGFVSQVQTDVNDIKNADPALVSALSNGVAPTIQGTAASAAIPTPVMKTGISTGTLLFLAIGAYFIFKKK